MRRVLVTLVLGGVCSLPIGASAGPITILEAVVQSCGKANGPSQSCSMDSSTAYGTRMVTANDGGASSTSWVNWIDAGTGGALFDFDFAHTRLGDQYSAAQSYESVTFIALEDTTYEISGTYTVTDVGSSGLVYSYANLWTTTQSVLFRDVSFSGSTSDAILTVGSNVDGEVNTFIGSSTGTLLAGQTYQWIVSHYISASPDSDSGASAIGCVTLSIGGATGAGSCGSPAAVPDNGISTGSLLALALGVVATAFHRLCRV